MLLHEVNNSTSGEIGDGSKHVDFLRTCDDEDTSTDATTNSCFVAMLPIGFDVSTGERRS